MENLQNPFAGVIPLNPPSQIVQGSSVSDRVGGSHAYSVAGVDIPRETPQHSNTITTINTGLAVMDSVFSRI